MLEENKKRLIELGGQVTPFWIKEQLAQCLAQLEKNMSRYQDQFPSACATKGIYRIKPNDDWTNGFFTGMLWLAYEISGRELFLQQALRNVTSFQKRLDEHVVLDHHDIGFLYSLSAGAGYRLTDDLSCKRAVLEAADVLLSRYQEKGGFIQAWGRYGEAKEYRLIIDSLLNLPLLFMASAISGKTHYQEIAAKHFHTVLATVIKKDGTTFHTYYFDPETGSPTYGATHQGNSDRSIWARGQSWAVLGIPLDESYLQEKVPAIYTKVVDVFLANLPADLVPYWDFDFTDTKPSDKDSSALVIAACGLLEAEKCRAYPDAHALAKGMIYQLGQHYTKKAPENEGLLQHGVYAHAEGKGVDEPNLWGDYFYLEALVRLAKPDWQRYW